MPTPPHGFRPSATSALLVPEDLSRDREVWTRDEWKVLERCAKLLASRRLDLLLRCQDDRCVKAGPIERLFRKDGGMTLRCGHLDRECQVQR